MKKYLIVLIVVALIIIGAGVVYWKLAKSTSTNPEQACTEEAKICPDGSAVGRQGPDCEFAPCPVAQAVDETADWKTYKNDKYGFEIKYPSGWFYTVSNYDGQQLICFNPKGTGGDCSGMLTVSWGVDFQKRYVAMKQMSEKNYKITESVIPIDNIEGKLLTIESVGFSKSVFFENKSYIYNFEVVAKYESLFNQILSTFKFTK